MDFSLFENKHIGERCFILGSAPSISLEDLSVLQDDIVFVCNKGYLLTDLLKLPKYDYYVCTDKNVYLSNHLQIKDKVKCPKFYSSKVIDGIPKGYDVGDYVLVRKKTEKGKLGHSKIPESFDESWGLTGSVVLEATMIAYFMGFTEIFLLGVDLKYSHKCTHFYAADEREKKNWNQINNNIDNIKKTIEGLNQFFKKRGIRFCNLSAGFSFNGIMETDSLSNIIN